jgi:uncharacterized protein (UPF0335 family)
VNSISGVNPDWKNLIDRLERIESALADLTGKVDDIVEKMVRRPDY